jgi:hypothetical protein
MRRRQSEVDESGAGLRATIDVCQRTSDPGDNRVRAHVQDYLVTDSARTSNATATASSAALAFS